MAGIGFKCAKTKMDMEILEQIIKQEPKEPEVRDPINKDEDYADARLIEEMMDLDIDEYKRLQKQLREEKREKRRKEECGGEKEKEEDSANICLSLKDVVQIDKEGSDESDDDKSVDHEFLESIASEFFEAVKIKMKKGELCMDDMNAAFKRFLFSRVLEKEKEKEKLESEQYQLEKVTNVRDCFGPPDACHNCESKGEAYKPVCARGAQCVSACEGTLKRCSGCHLVAYCSEKCQKEHWIYNHQKMCKMLSGRKQTKQYRHHFDKCETCADRIGSAFREKNSLLLPCGIATIQIYLMNHYWLHFGYHREAACNCSPEWQRKMIKNMTFPMNPPFVMGEISGEYLGWIDEYLAILGVYLVAIEAKYEDEIESLGIKSNMSQIAMFIIGIRANYWYFITSERSRAMSEVLFTQRMHLISPHIVDKDTKHLHEIDTAFKTLNQKNVWWETFLHHFAAFYRRLRRTRYVLFNTEDIPKNKKKEFDIFENLHDNAILHLSKSVEILLPMSPGKKLGDLLPGFLFQLSSDQKCHICKINIGGKRAQYQLQIPLDQNFWNVHESKTLEEIMLVRFPKLPIIFEDLREDMGSALMVTCGTNNTCNAQALQLQLEYYEMITKANINFAMKSQRCDGCLKFTYESHRCSGCRAVRYCSKDCLVEDWKVHQNNCAEYAKDSTKESVACRKLEGADKRAYFDHCVYWLGKCDPIMKVILSMWKDKNIGYEQLCEVETDKNRDRKKKKKCDKEGASKFGNESASKQKEEESKNAKEADNIEGKGAENKKIEEAKSKEVKQTSDKKTEAECRKVKIKSKKMKEAESSKGKDVENEESKGDNDTKRTKATLKEEKIIESKISKETEKNEERKARNNSTKATSKGMKEADCKKTKNNNNGAEFKKQKQSKTKEENEDKESDHHGLKIIKELPPFMKEFIDANMSSLSENGVKVMVCSVGKNGKGMNMKPFITEDEDGNKTVHKENLPENQRRKSSEPEEKKEEQRKPSASKSPKEKKKLPTGKLMIKPANMEKVRKIIRKHRLDTMQGKHFEIRHIKNQAWLNEKICQVIEAEPKNEDLFDPRVVCKLKIEKKQFSLKQTNLVDIGADIDDIAGTYCEEGHMFRKSSSNLSNFLVKKQLNELISWAKDTEQTRPDQLYRLDLLGQYIRGEITEIECKANPNYKEIGDLNENECFAYCLSAVRPGCVGDNFIHFNRFNQLICECPNQLIKRFREFIVTGSCHCCQGYYIERQGEQNQDPLGKVFYGCSRVKSLDGLTLVNAG